MNTKTRFIKGFTIIEIIITIVLVGLVLIPLGFMATEYIRGTFYSRDLGAAEGLAKDELSKVNNLAFTDLTLADGYDNITGNYQGYPYDLRRSVNYVPGSNNALKQVQIRIYLHGDLSKQLVSMVTYVANVPFGAGSGGSSIYIPGPCFLSGTPILMSDGSLKPIENVKVGDAIIAFDEKTGEFKEDKVVEFFVHDTDRYLLINDYLKVTANHPVYHEGKWVEIGNLKVGDNILNSLGQPEAIRSIEEVKEKALVYNFEVNPYHTYVAGGIVAHNKPCLLAGTPILMSDGSLKSIEQVQVGDSIMAFDEKTASFKEDKVSKFFHHKADKYLIINDNFKVTPNHPVYSSGKWIEIGSLVVGDNLFNSEGKSVIIDSIREVSADTLVYNLEVNPYHTYVAGGFVVHNKPIPTLPVEQNLPGGGDGF